MCLLQFLVAQTEQTWWLHGGCVHLELSEGTSNTTVYGQLAGTSTSSTSDIVATMEGVGQHVSLFGLRGRGPATEVHQPAVASLPHGPTWFGVIADVDIAPSAPRLMTDDQLADEPAAAVKGGGDEDWWTCSGFSAAYADAKFNGTEAIPFYGKKDSVEECRGACEADQRCTAFLYSGPSPHISPTHQNWASRCYGRRDTKWVLTPMADEYCGCNHRRDPTGCPDPSTGSMASVAVDAGSCLAPHGRTASLGSDRGGCRSAARVAAGVLLSINETHPRAEIIRPLRLSAHRGDWDHLPTEAARLRSLGFTTIQSLLPDLWVQNVTGYNSFSSLVAGRCAAPGCWPGDKGDWGPWERWVADIVSSAPEGVEFDIWCVRPLSLSWCVGTKTSFFKGMSLAPGPGTSGTETSASTWTCGATPSPRRGACGRP